MLATRLLHKTMPFVLISADRRFTLQNGSSTPIGRAHAVKCPEAMFVSRQQCLISVSEDGRHVALQHTGTGNPTLVLKAGQQQHLLTQGESVALAAGDSFALLATRPADALRLVLEGEQQQQQQQQQQQPAVTRASPALACCTAVAAVAASGGGSKQPVQSHPQPAVVAAAGAAGAGGDSDNPAAAPKAADAVGTSPAPNGPAAAPAASAAAAAAAATGTSAAEAAASAARQPHSANPVMLILVGIPGSGKSTFANNLAQRSSRSWVRVNQDTIRNGKNGTRQQCVNAARRALATGRNVVVDRCNLDATQRLDFLTLAAALGAPAHALFINLPTSACVKRAAERADHEGGVDGTSAPRVVNSMAAQLKKAGLISAAGEAFASVTTAVNDHQVAAALKHWAAADVGIAASAAAQQAAPAAAAADDDSSDGRPAKRARSDLPAAAAAAAAAGKGVQRQEQQQGQTAAAAAAAGDGKAGGEDAGKPAAAVAKPGKSAFAVLMAGAKTQQQQQQQQQAKSPKQTGPRPGPWSSALAQIAADPDRFQDQQTIWHTDEQVVGILDKYPKSSVHGLMIARQPGLDSVSMLRGKHLPLLQHMREVAVGWIQQQQQQQQEAPLQPPSGALPTPSSSSSSSSSSIPQGWRLGFHSIPSMTQLHLHIVSDDFNSEWLKTKKHWNSFTSPFFLKLDDVIVTLQQQGSVSVDRVAAEGLLKQGLVCHKCGQKLPNMPQLKAHLLTH